MYTEYFGLRELPFSIAPDPRYLYMSDLHREALAHLVYGIKTEGGFVLLTGEVGTGKTTVCRCLLEQIPENADIAFILNPKMTVEELLATLCDELRIGYSAATASVKVFVDLINAYLLDAHARGRKTVLIIEEAQNLGPDVLEQVRLLTNLETNQRKLLQIIMVGQPELKEMLSLPELRQLAQRITARYHLGPLSRREVHAYVQHRLSVAGAIRTLFPPQVIGTLYRLSRGIPRLINVICDRALLGAYVEGKERVDKRTLLRAAREVFGEEKGRGSRSRMLKWLLAGSLFTFCIGAVTAFYYYQTEPLAKMTPQASRNVAVPAHVREPAIDRPLLSPVAWPINQPIHHSKEIGYQSLFEQWDIVIKPGKGIPCEQAQARGLGCFDGKGNLSGLLAINRPALVKLNDDQGKEFYATITSVRDKTATLVMGTETRIVDLEEVEKKWPGEYTVLWRMPPDYQGVLRPGQKGKAVQWLDERLAPLQGRPVQARTNLVFDEDLVSEVKKFQLSRGLVPDGLVGPQTIIHLNSAAVSGEPLLLKKKEKDK